METFTYAQTTFVLIFFSLSEKEGKKLYVADALFHLEELTRLLKDTPVGDGLEVRLGFAHTTELIKVAGFQTAKRSIKY